MNVGLSLEFVDRALRHNCSITYQPRRKFHEHILGISIRDQRT